MSSESLETLENDQCGIHRELSLLSGSADDEDLGSEDLGSEDLRSEDLGKGSLRWNAQNPEGEALGICPDKDQKSPRSIMNKVIPELPNTPVPGAALTHSESMGLSGV